ncbi:flagellar biosynthetic protein FliO [Vreelandella populi]|uniref:Flagellar protein n=1 Tax=Vreelandella populi TaxID=2498858 RepID=A0A3S1E617_9GAMM|nr:flagellar biosynthetic protein FliO [Halomonas populi]RUR41397.1 flagellar biosynthetic protein FliO [Halomonas populi]RUR44199.1 flagellar biosynthetic protein FliO [Halomonas populi]RUR56191.1 flagellar biosynthetic protein FliO [Halomonas populi]
MSVETAPLQNDALDALGNGSDAFVGLAMLGKTAAALAFVIALILLCTALLKRWQNTRIHQGAHLRVITSTAVGSRERVVVVEIEDTWLVLGVSGGRITKLHERPAPDERPVDDAAPPHHTVRFAQRLSQALAKHRRNRADDDPHQTP